MRHPLSASLGMGRSRQRRWRAQLLVRDAGARRTGVLTAWTNPQMEISRHRDDLVVIGRAFIQGNLDYTGTDTIPSDKMFEGGCAHYNHDWTYGSTLLPGDYDTAKVSLPVKELAHLPKGNRLTAKVRLGQNTLYPPQQVCDSVFTGRPTLCIINSQSLRGEFTWARFR